MEIYCISSLLLNNRRLNLPALICFFIVNQISSCCLYLLITDQTLLQTYKNKVIDFSFSFHVSHKSSLS